MNTETTRARVSGTLDPIVRCHGACRDHIGTIKRVRVYDPQARTHADWGEFNYCDAAIAEDESRGLRVEIATPNANLHRAKMAGDNAGDSE